MYYYPELRDTHPDISQPEGRNNMTNRFETTQSISFPKYNILKAFAIIIFCEIVLVTEAQPSGDQTFATFYGASDGDGSDGKHAMKGITFDS